MTKEELVHLVGFLFQGLDACVGVNLVLPFLPQKVCLELLDGMTVMGTHFVDLAL